MSLQKRGVWGAAPARGVWGGGGGPPISKNLKLFSFYENKAYQGDSGPILNALDILFKYNSKSSSKHLKITGVTIIKHTSRNFSQFAAIFGSAK